MAVTSTARKIANIAPTASPAGCMRRSGSGSGVLPDGSSLRRNRICSGQALRPVLDVTSHLSAAAAQSLRSWQAHV